MNKNIQSQVYKILYQVLADAKTEVDIELIMKALMSEAEVMAIAKRLAIAVFLDKGQSYEHIRETLKVSSATIANVAEGMNKRGIQMALARVKAEEWADVWSIRLSKALEKLMK
ncbi:TPA: hypothetical protein DD448_02320 [Candidatus Collierbacteria bacterium]|jgi:uncharacterized protein YerC|uniref:TrpR-related protein YerC/YecD n=2 Tax=Candidatus Collieribacteriota TaxID=1752725 RepID=A0A1F5FZP6_9BACT|nr:MAG: hypothetical protein UX32_C0026G0006 [Microgenomates group bacterium GW2011_GWF1_46_12]KKU27501.1 MAG: hypothetical protein UX40_C0013G0006 [Microgenomates group bacterium GW2011_GWF2_46_18]KKU44918.1 MAG: hypothetical protein UX63_C0018G0013 [Microgenomates group bacterium GW2011_GWB1_46_7]KKU60692.1 MAG: hypothetical protein UX82_C0008G0016 [Microgenomates group bacterium GW2011_GWE1_47_12]KKU61075.1 MAG: hypothetical protein UX84_C0020G0005 [Microgenomates group bacterium GW2011_GWD1